MRYFSMQFRDLNSGQAIISAGGKVHVAKNGSPDKQALVNKDGSALANPITPTRGKIEFYIADDTVTTVDLYGMAPGGQAFQIVNLTASGPNEINIDTSRRHQTLVVPFSIADTAANTQTTTGFKTGTDKVWRPEPFIKVTTLEAAKTLNVGTSGAGSNDNDGVLAGISLAAAGVVKGTLTNGAATIGALMFVQDSANAGDKVPEGFIDAADEDITYTLAAASAAAKGFIYLPYLLAA